MLYGLIDAHPLVDWALQTKATEEEQLRSKALAKYAPGQIVKGRVVASEPRGLVVRISKHLEGFIYNERTHVPLFLSLS